MLPNTFLLLELSLLKFIIELARDKGSSAFDVKPEFDSLIIFDPIPFKEAIIGLPQARYDWSLPGIVIENIFVSFNDTSRASAEAKKAGISSGGNEPKNLK